MRRLLCTALLLVCSGLAFGQNVPNCDPNNPAPNCTDYFGVANWANSPLPAGSITGFTIVSSGSGYVNPVVVITDAAGTGATAPSNFTFDASGGVATITGGGGGTGYIAPQISIVDVGAGGSLAAPACVAIGQPACGSGALATAVLGGPFTGGLRKFVDQLPNLALGVPDTATFPGSDYYVIELVQYTTKMHADLPPTTLRGYCQLIGGTCTPSYLGPTIIAQKNRPVRVLFKNLLPTGAGGNLFIPTDTTYMGAGAPYTQNRGELHLHGGATPWISDGTPHQWTVPVGENGGPARGDSVQFVPDMWFDGSGVLIPVCAGLSTCTVANATNDPGIGSLTYFWTNQQGGRLMFYHDHAYGITRLNVYAGEAAGYLLTDPVEEAALKNATVPGTIVDLPHLIPLVIQDKTFVPSAAQLAAEDPTWTAGSFGTIPGFVNPGDLWFPHVYVPNQNPVDSGGANAFGRWDYGPWTLPGAQTTLLAANPSTAVDIPCTSSAFPNATVNCPITPNPSGTPEGFMDTPVVNGKAYPVLHVAPEAYRFKILSVGNDRSLNLQLYKADPAVTTPDGRKNTEVKMVPAVQPAAGALLPLCTALTPITNTTLFMGLATAILDGSGNPINGTGLPANCWPNFGAGTQTAGMPIQQTMWAADGRAGGAPDPTTAGPPFIQIGTEGGLLPSPVVIPAMPTGYEANTRSVTITNVSVHGLWLGPAERADVIVDFSKFGGHTLILYNDAPTPAPAVDSRDDYFTGDGDQTPIGGAPNTLPGYGPNTRTLMQIIVDQPPTGQTTFSLPALTAALPSLFAQTQPVPIVPEPTYPPASGGYSPIETSALISDASLTFFPVGSTTSVTFQDQRKAIQELFTLDYGRMNATLGVELPLTNFLTQTTIPLGYIDPPTEIIKQGDTQLWKITHNGVDTHFIHFHLFNVQVINRMGWDGTKRPIDANELGWKDTVRMNPLEDILVALQPITPVLPFPLRDSYRLLDVTMPAHGPNCPATFTTSPLPCSIFTNIDPSTNIGTQTPNAVNNFGWEYVWHCHILGHEENDMMRAITFQVPPEAPSNLSIAAAVTGLTLSWTDNSASETGFTLQRADDAGFTLNAVSTTVSPLGLDANGQGITWG
jgi:FtsP/CotA-like multicopper oxidase with cupredoxin domain